jgi:hypothetical protein
MFAEVYGGRERKSQATLTAAMAVVYKTARAFGTCGESRRVILKLAHKSAGVR